METLGAILAILFLIEVFTGIGRAMIAARFDF